MWTSGETKVLHFLQPMFMVLSNYDIVEITGKYQKIFSKASLRTAELLSNFILTLKENKNKKSMVHNYSVQLKLFIYEKRRKQSSYISQIHSTRLNMGTECYVDCQTMNFGGEFSWLSIPYVLVNCYRVLLGLCLITRHQLVDVEEYNSYHLSFCRVFWDHQHSSS